MAQTESMAQTGSDFVIESVSQHVASKELNRDQLFSAVQENEESKRLKQSQSSSSNYAHKWLMQYQLLSSRQERMYFMQMSNPDSR